MKQFELDFKDIDEIDDEAYWEQQPQIVMPNYSDYVIFSKQGLIWSKKRNKWIGAKNKKSGYWYCTLCSDDGKIWTNLLHRIIWIACNGEIPTDMQVNHRDENLDNNSVSNLNLLTQKENNNWGTRTERAAKAMKGKFINRKDQSKAVGMYKNGVLIMTFPSTMEVQRQLGLNNSSISQCCNGKQQSHKGFQWQYIN